MQRPRITQATALQSTPVYNSLYPLSESIVLSRIHLFCYKMYSHEHHTIVSNYRF